MTNVWTENPGEVNGKKTLTYILTNPGKMGTFDSLGFKNSKVGNANIKTYAPGTRASKASYVLITKDQKNTKLALTIHGGHRDSHVYLSQDLIDALKDGSYPWYEMNRKGTIDEEKYTHSVDDDSVEDGFLLPARDDDGDVILVEPHSRIRSVHKGHFWDTIETGARNLKESFTTGVGFRSVDKDGQTMYIRAPQGQFKRTHNGTEWSDVKRIFNEVGKRTKTKYFFLEGSTTGYTILSTSPFGLYETWMKNADYVEYIRTHPDRAFPSNDAKTIQGLEQAEDKLIWGQIKDKEQDKRLTKVMDTQHININQGYVSAPLSSERMDLAAGKRTAGGVDDQNKVEGGLSAPKFGEVVLKWDPKDKSDNLSIAEHLHLIGFANGGLIDGPKAYLSSQIQHNLVIGTSETNSVMLRYERSIVKAFQKEQKLRTLWEEVDLEDPAVAGKRRKKQRTTVEGSIEIFLNQDMPIYSNEIAKDGKSVIRKKREFNKSPWHKKTTEIFTGLAYHLDYKANISGISRLFGDVQDPSVDVEFQPFARPFFTKGEALADDALIEMLFEVGKEKVTDRKEQLKREAEARLKPKKKNNKSKIVQMNMMVMSPNLAIENTARVEKMAAGDDVLDIYPQSMKMNQEPTVDYNVSSPIVGQDDHIDTSPIDQRTDEPSMDKLVSEITFEQPPDAAIIERLLQNAKGETRGFLLAGPSSNSPIITSYSYQAPAGRLQANSNFGEQMSVAHIDEIRITEKPSITIGGVILQNPALVAAIPGRDGAEFADIPVVIKVVEAASSSPGVLLMPTADEATEKPVLLLSSQVVNGLEISDRLSIPPTMEALQDVAAFAESNTGVAVLGSGSKEMVLSGDVDSFLGVPGLRAKLYSYQSADPDEPLLEMAVPDLTSLGGNTLGRLMPFVTDSLFQEIPLDNVKFTYTEREDLLGCRGLHVEADLVFEGVLSCVQDSLDLVLGSSAPKALHISAFLGQERIWNERPTTSALRLKGSFENLSIWLPGNVARLSSIGVEVSSVLMSGMGSNETERWVFGYGLFGTMELYMGSKVPLEVAYKISKASDSYHLGMTLESKEWTNILGVQGLTLTEVAFETSFTSKTFRDSFTIKVSAIANIGPMRTFVSGFYSKDYSYLEAELGNLTIADLSQIYEQLMEEPMSQDLLDHNIKLESFYLRVSTDGLVLSGTVSFNDHSAASATISFSKLGLSISGAVTDVKIPDVNITVKEVGLDLLIASRPKGQAAEVNKSRFALKGMVDFNGLSVSVGLVVGQKWMVYGRVASDMPLSKVASTLEGTFLENIVLRDVALLASNQSEEDAKGMNVMDYPVGKGPSLCARIDRIEAFDKMASGGKPTKESIKGMILVAAYSAGVLKLSIILHNVTFDLSDNVAFGNLAVAIEISKKPKFVMSGDLTISMKDQLPLVLAGSIYAGVTDAGGFIETKTIWKNPLGISDNVEIRKLALDLAFNYALGIQRVGIDGDIAVGDVNSAAGLVVGSSHEQLIKIKLDNLHVKELIHFVGRSFDIRPLRDLACGDFLVFVSAGMYFSTGTSIGSQVYPAGASAHGTLTLFGKSGGFKASIGSDGVIFAGSIDNFAIGPLEVRSASGAPQASIDFTLTREKQHFKVDGMVKLWTFELKMLINISASPVAFSVWIYLDLGSIVTMELMAEAKNIDNMSDLSKADLLFSFEIKGDPLGKICDAILALLDVVQQFGTETFEVVEARLKKQIKNTEQKRAEILGVLADQRRALEDRRSKRDSIIAEQLKIRDEAEVELERLRQLVEEAKGQKSDAVQEAERKLQAAKREKEDAVRDKKAEYQKKLDQATTRQEELEREQRALEHKKFTLYSAVAKEVDNKLRNFKDKDEIAEGLESEVRHLKWVVSNGDFWDRGGAALKLSVVGPTAVGARALADTLRGLWSLADQGLKSAGQQDLITEISKKVGEVTHAGMALNRLIEEGEEGFIRGILDTEERRVSEARKILEAERDGNSRLTQAIIEAQNQLDNVRGPELWRVIHAADERILQVQEDTELAVTEARVRAQEQLEADVGHELQTLKETVQWAKEDFIQGSEKVKELMRDFQKAVFRVTGVKVQASARAMVEGKPLTFTVTGVVGGEEKVFVVEWAPLAGVADFYQGIVKQVVSL
ncbi:hypothetical protein ACHAPU_006181 [Fusarium lateritium]